MAKKASNTENTPTPISSISDESSQQVSKLKMVLRVRKSEKNRDIQLVDEDDEEEECRFSEKVKRTKSIKRPKIDSKKKKQKTTTQKVDPKMPKKPPTAFFYFLEDFRKEYQEQNPNIKSMRDIGKACGEKWKTMTYEEKVNYYDVATEKRAEFDEAMAEYIKKKESGEDQESEDDSEFDE